MLHSWATNVGARTTLDRYGPYHRLGETTVRASEIFVLTIDDLDACAGCGPMHLVQSMDGAVECVDVVIGSGAVVTPAGGDHRAGPARSLPGPESYSVTTLGSRSGDLRQLRPVRMELIMAKGRWGSPRGRGVRKLGRVAVWVAGGRRVDASGYELRRSAALLP